MKRILQVTGSLRVGGLETVAMNCLRYADRNRYEFDFLVYGDQVEEYEYEAVEYGCRVIHIPVPKKDYIGFYKNIQKVIENYGPYDIVHSHTFFNSGIVMKAAYKKNVPLRISHAHSVGRKNYNTIYKKIYSYVMRRWILKYSSKYCACSKQAGEYLFTKKVFTEQGILFPNTIDVQKYQFSRLAREKIRRELEIDDSHIVLGQVGHLSPEKNQEFLLEVFSEYCKTQNAILLLVGDGKLRDHLEHYAKELLIEKQVRFVGTRQDVPDCLSAMDCFICTSKHEGFGLVLIEAQANGLRCLVEENTLVDEIRELGKCKEIKGFDAKAWCKEIKELVKMREYECDLQFLLQSKYSNDSLKSVIEKVYCEGVS